MSNSITHILSTAVRRAYVPIFAETIRPRVLALVIAGVGAAQLGLSSAFNLGFPCAFHAMTGVPCPGCGLTRSVLALLKGHPYDSFELHPFGALLLAALVFALIVGVLPDRIRARLIYAVERFESKTGITALLMAVFMLLWSLRITGVVHLASV